MAKIRFSPHYEGNLSTEMPNAYERYCVLQNDVTHWLRLLGENRWKAEITKALMDMTPEQAQRIRDEEEVKV